MNLHELKSNLVREGYTIFTTEHNLMHDKAVFHAQKWVRDWDGNKLYCLNAYGYDLTSFIPNRCDLQWDCQFTSETYGTFDITYVTNDILTAQTFFSKMFTDFRCEKEGC